MNVYKITDSLYELPYYVSANSKEDAQEKYIMHLESCNMKHDELTITIVKMDEYYNV